ncbi:MAG: hypothetical protein Ct9H90mP22_4310 [Gammaproteobacteria bacterium]|nr:MAG: hypothetical protein Ct9H90mP22_4310 [Gammaproteobacteria bacterium]
MKIKLVCFCWYCRNHIKSLNSQGAVGIKDKEVTNYDIDRVIDSAKRYQYHQIREFFMYYPRICYDGQEVSLDPLGMSG